jgi:hypothetical protein
MALTVTFDTGALDDVVWPQSAKQPTDPAQAARVRAAVVSGGIKGFFSETLITLEGIKREDRIDVLGSARLERDSWSPAPNVITTSLSFRQDRKPLPRKFVERIQAARKLGMRALMVPRLLGDGVCAKDDDGTLFEPLGDPEQFVSKATSLRKEIGGRGVGHAAAIDLGLQFSARDGVSEWWYHGLLRTKDIHERRKVVRAVGEWADGDSIAAHYGYGVKLFCSKDRGGRRGDAASILDPDNREWLTNTYGIRFVNMAELAEMVPV